MISKMTFFKFSAKPFLLFLMLLICFGSYAQQNTQKEEGEIVMTSAELQSFIQRVAALKRERMETEQKEKIISELEQAVSKQLAARQPVIQTIGQAPSNARAAQQELSSTPTQPQIDKGEIADLNARMDILLRMMETMRLQLNESEYRRDVLSRADLPRQSRIQDYNPDSYYRAAPQYRQTQPTQGGEPSAETYSREAPTTTQMYAGQQGRVVPAQSDEAGIPDTIYVLQGDTGYETVVAPGVSKLQPTESRQTTVAPDPVIPQQQTSRQERVRVVQAPPQTVYLDRGRNRNQQPVVIYRDQRDNRRTQQPAATDSAEVKAQQQQLATEKKIGELQTEVSLLRELMAGAEKDDEQKYIDDINRLKMQISALTSELETKNMKQTEAKEKTEEKPEPKPGTTDTKAALPASHAIYFANNSVEIPVNDYASLKEIANQMKGNGELLLLLRGFASSVGNAAYNQKIAGQRATAVQKWLVQNGVAPDQIITQGQGVDTSKQEEKARRVEITFLSK